MVAQLRVVAALSGMTPPRSHKIMLAVLPFENLTGDPNKEYLADGLTEETISQLGRLNPEQLGVIARTSVMGYKHKDERLDQIGRDLSVEYVLENSLRESGNHIRLTSQLIQVKDQTHVWSQDYDYSMKDILNIEDDVAKAVAQEIRLRLTPQQYAELAEPRPSVRKPSMPTCRGTTSFSGTPTKMRIWRQSITNGRLNLIPPMRWLGPGCLGYATGRPTQALFPLRTVTGLRVKQLSEL